MQGKNSVGLLGLFKSGKTIKNTLEGVGSLAVDLRSALTGDIPSEKRAELEIKAQQIESELLQAQAEINAIEAASKKLFVAGWRPFIGWIGGIGLGLYYIPQFAFGAFVWIKIFITTGQIAPYPVSANGLLELVLALLGVAGMRTYEKKQGIQDKH